MLEVKYQFIPQNFGSLSNRIPLTRSTPDGYDPVILNFAGIGFGNTSVVW